jgi:hypothetical protein
LVHVEQRAQREDLVVALVFYQSPHLPQHGLHLSTETGGRGEEQEKGAIDGDKGDRYMQQR